MEGLAPPLELLMSVKRAIEKGLSVKVGIVDYLKRSNGEFAVVVTRWFGLLQQGQDPQACRQVLSSIHRRTLLLVLERGLRGEPIYSMLLQLEEEMIEACHEEITNKIAKLPFLLLIPLLLFQFPAFLLLLFGPLLQNFFPSFGGQ